jgi:hypothetical protein
MAIVGMSALVLSALSLLWAIVGIFKPNVLFCVPKEKRTRKHAACFPLLVSLVCFLLMAAAAGAGWFAWVLAGIIAFLTWGYLLNLRGYEPLATLARQGGGKLRNIEVYSSDFERKYTIDLVDYTCTCPDWIKRRSLAPPETPFRICKHIATHLVVYKPKLQVPAWVEAYWAIIITQSSDDRGLPYWEENSAECGEKDGDAYIISVYPEKYPWASICKGLSSYGFNLEEKRWARGEKPFDHRWFEEKAYSLTGQEHPQV